MGLLLGYELCMGCTFLFPRLVCGCLCVCSLINTGVTVGINQLNG